MGNRVEDLETQVAELQAAVDGLTEELVEAKERISQLEQATTVEEESSPSRNPNAEFVPNESAANGSETMADEEDDAQKTARGSDGDASGEADGDSGDDDSDDIIVA